MIGGDVGQPVVGTFVLGAFAAAFAGVGVAIAGLWRSSWAAPAVALLTIVTWFIDMIAPALQAARVVHELALTAHYGLPMLGQWDIVGLVASVVLAVGGVAVGAWAFRGATSAAERPPSRPTPGGCAGSIGAWIPSSSSSSRARPSSTSRGTSSSRPPAIRSGRRRSGWRRRRPSSARSRCDRLARVGRPPIPTETLVLSVVSGAPRGAVLRVPRLGLSPRRPVARLPARPRHRAAARRRDRRRASSSERLGPVGFAGVAACSSAC